MLYRFVSRGVFWQSLNTGGECGNTLRSKTLMFHEKEKEVITKYSAPIFLTVIALFQILMRYIIVRRCFPLFFSDETEM